MKIETGFRGSKKKHEQSECHDNDISRGAARDRVVVRALALHQCGPGSIPRSGVKCGLNLLVVYSAPRGFLRELRFPISSKTKI